MKFTPESLIEIYLNGSFTEEAQAEFDELMRRDASFAERVTNSVAEKLGPPPEGMVERVSGNLDPKMDGLWLAHRPSPWGRALSFSFKTLLLLAALGGVYGTVQYFEARYHEGSGMPQNLSAGAGLTNSTPGIKDRAKHPRGLSPIEVDGKDRSAKPENDSRTISLSFKKQTTSTDAGQAGSMEGSRFPEMGTNPPSKTGPTGQAVPASSRSEEGNALRVSIEMERSGKAMITVLDPNGLIVRRLYEGMWSQGTHLLDWDGKDEAGNPVQPGNYTVAVNAGGKTLLGTLTIRADR